MIDLEAIGERNKKRTAEHFADAGGTAFWLREPLPFQDIDTLLAEVERLTASVSCIHCAAERDHGTGPFCYDHREPK